MNAANTSEISPIVTISGPGASASGLTREQHLEAQQGVERDVEQQAREHRRDRGRALGVGIRQPGMQRRQPHLGAVTEQQEHKGDVEQRRIEKAAAHFDRRPHHGVEAFADHRPRRHVDQDGAEQGEGAMPTLLGMKYFQAASSASWVR